MKCKCDYPIAPLASSVLFYKDMFICLDCGGQVTDEERYKKFAAQRIEASGCYTVQPYDLAKFDTPNEAIRIKYSPAETKREAIEAKLKEVAKELDHIKVDYNE